MAEKRSGGRGSGETPDRNTKAGSRAPDEARAFHFRDDSEESIPALVRRLAEEGSDLAQQQMRLVEAEVRSGVHDIKQSVGAMAGAAVLGVAGLGVLLMGIAFALAQVVPLWAATLIVAVVALSGAYAMLVAGQKKLQSSSVTVERTKRTLERAPSTIAGEADKGPKP
jgi:hypothetical protein